MLSDQVLEPSTPTPDEFTKTCQSMKLEFPNSFVFYVDSKVTMNAVQLSNSSGSLNENNSDLSWDLASLNLNDDGASVSSSSTLDPLNAAAMEQTRNSRFYESMQQQRQQQQTSNQKKGENEAGSGQLQSKDIINEWFINMNSHEQLKGILETISGTIDFMLR